MTAVPDQPRRRALFAKLVRDGYGDNKAEAARRLRLSSGAYVRQLIVGERPITEKTVAKIESANNRQWRGWFDQEPDAPNTISTNFATRLFAGAAPPSQDHRLSQSPADDSPHNKGETAMRSSEVQPGYVRLQVMAVASAGPGRTSEGQELIEHVDVAEDWVRRTLRANPSNVRVVTARGHSMTGLIEDGDALFVTPTTEFIDDGIYVIAIGDLLRVKRLRLRVTDKMLSIESNDGSSPETVPLAHADDSLRICGRVVGAWSLRRM